MRNFNLQGSVAKLSEALALLKDCFGEKGVWASPDRYKDTCWTRDFAYAICPALCLMREYAVVRNHLEHLIARQRPDGSMPILYLDDEGRWVQGKLVQEIRTGREPFMLKRYREGEVENLTPGTRDSEICFLTAMFHYVDASGDEAFLKIHRAAVDKAYAYILGNLVNEEGLVTGADWRDTMHEELRDTAVLTNNALMIGVHRSMGANDAADALYDRLPRAPEGGFLDYVGSGRVDPLGLAFLAPNVEFMNVGGPTFEKACRTVDSPHGVTIKCRHKPGGYSAGNEADVIEQTNGVVVWPFVVGLTVIAALKNGEIDFALEQFEKLHKLKGFWEWYRPETGEGYGAPRQLWSAALYIRAFFALQEAERIGPV